MNGPVIETRGLCKVFPSAGGGSLTVLDGLDLVVDPGELVCVLGPTGCGKTTLLRILSGLEPCTAGEVQLSAGTKRAAAGVVFQQNSLLPWRRVLANVTFPMEMAGVPRGRARSAARELLELVQLEGVEQAYPYELSGGMQQRAAIARALATGSDLLLFDEPFGALDDQTRIVLQEVLLDIWQERRATVLFVTHNIEEALVLGSRILVLGGGRILEDRSVELPRPRDRFAPDFVAALMELRKTFAAAVLESAAT